MRLKGDPREWLYDDEATKLTGRSLSTLYAWKAREIVTSGLYEGRRVWERKSLLRALEWATARRGGARPGSGQPRLLHPLRKNQAGEDWLQLW